MDVIIVFTNV